MPGCAGAVTPGWLAISSASVAEATPLAASNTAPATSIRRIPDHIGGQETRSVRPLPDGTVYVINRCDAIGSRAIVDMPNKPSRVEEQE